jgi:hypothetical protein
VVGNAYFQPTSKRWRPPTNNQPTPTMGNSDRKTAAIRKLLDKADCPRTPCSEILARAINALRKWDAACTAAEKCNAYSHSEQFKYRQWKTLSNRHDRLLADAESEKDAVLALIDSRNAEAMRGESDARTDQTACSPSHTPACSRS